MIICLNKLHNFMFLYQFYIRGTCEAQYKILNQLINALNGCNKLTL